MHNGNDSVIIVDAFLIYSRAAYLSPTEPFCQASKSRFTDDEDFQKIAHQEVAKLQVQAFRSFSPLYTSFSKIFLRVWNGSLCIRSRGFMAFDSSLDCHPYHRRAAIKTTASYGKCCIRSARKCSTRFTRAWVSATNSRYDMRYFN